MSFVIHALPAAAFAPLFALSPDELAARGGVLRVADRCPGFPCRVSLRDAEVGETVVLVHYEHQRASSPFRASHAIYVRRNAIEARIEPGRIPELLHARLLSVRAFDDAGMMVDADVVEGHSLAPMLDRMLSSRDVAYVHLHFAKPGCYAARVDREACPA
jgi:hypothetical protein